VNETVGLLAARAEVAGRSPDAVRAGWAVVVGGTPNPQGRDRRGSAVLLRQSSQAQDKPARHREPDGDLLWVPGSVHDKKGESFWGVIAKLETAGLVTLAR
jgi:hypothetical protein